MKSCIIISSNGISTNSAGKFNAGGGARISQIEELSG